MTGSLILKLQQLAPSVNAAYGNRRAGQVGRGRYVTPKLAKWREMAGKEIMAQLAGRARPVFAGEVEVCIRALRPPRNIRTDGDGRVKATLDLLGEMGVYPDDSHQWVVKSSMGWVNREEWTGPHTCEIEIIPLPMKQAQIREIRAAEADNGPRPYGRGLQPEGMPSGQRRGARKRGGTVGGAILRELAKWGISPEQVTVCDGQIRVVRTAERTGR